MAVNDSKGRDERLLIALAGGTGVVAAAERAGISEDAAYGRLEDADFRSRLQSMRSELLTTAVGKFASTMNQAADTLAELLHSESDSTRLRAARAILDLGPKLTEALVLESRISELERRVSESETGSDDPTASDLASRLLQR
jgi:hypothetical protein